MQAQQLSKLWRAVVLLGLGALALFALAACGGDDNDAPAAGGTPAQVSAPTTAPAALATPAPTATRVPPAARMVPMTAPEPGSDEEQILVLLEKQVRAVNEKDYALFQKTCTPNATSLKTREQLKFVFEDLSGPYCTTCGTIIFTPEGYNVRNVEVKLLRSPFAQATLDIYEFDALQGNVMTTFEKVDGQWYSESNPCGQSS